MRSGPGEARTILLLHIISVTPSKQPLMVRTFLKVYMELGSYFLFLQEHTIFRMKWCINGIKIILIYMCGMKLYHFISYHPNVVHMPWILCHTIVRISYQKVFISYLNVCISYPCMTSYVFYFHGRVIPYL